MLRRDPADIIKNVKQRSLTVLLTMLTQNEIAITEHTYPYDTDIYDDKGMVSLYDSLAKMSF